MALALPLLLSMQPEKPEKPAYIIYDSKGEEVPYSAMTEQLLEYDVVFFGELHNDPIAHWLQRELTMSLHASRGERLTIAMEMFETDNQLLLDEYLSGKIRETNFESEAKLWRNYQTDYKPVVLFAKENSLRVIASNVPRRYAAIVAAGGFEALEQLGEESLKYIAPLPFDYDPELPSYKRMLTMVGGAMGSHANENLPKAQALKDVTMAWAIASNYREGDMVLHINGSYHSNHHEGIVWYLKREMPELKIAVINQVLQGDISALEEQHKDSADFVIVVPATMTRTY